MLLIDVLSMNVILFSKFLAKKDKSVNALWFFLPISARPQWIWKFLCRILLRKNLKFKKIGKKPKFGVAEKSVFFVLFILHWKNQYFDQFLVFFFTKRHPRCKGGTPALRLVALSMPRDQTLSGAVLPHPPTPNAPVWGHRCRLRLYLSLAHILCELRRARAHA